MLAIFLSHVSILFPFWQLNDEIYSMLPDQAEKLLIWLVVFNRIDLNDRDSNTLIPDLFVSSSFVSFRKQDSIVVFCSR